MPFQTAIILIVVAVVVSAVVFGAIAFRIGVSHRKKIAEATMGSAEEEAKRIVSEAIKDAEAKKRSP